MNSKEELKCLEFVNKRIYNNASINEMDKMLSDVSVNLQNENGDTLLLLACRNRDLELIDYLLKHNADANISNKQGVRPLKYIREEIKKLNRKINKVHYYNDVNSEYHRNLMSDYRLLSDIGSSINKNGKNKLKQKEDILSM